MSESDQAIVIPNRSLFKAAEVCELLKVKPYVLRTWEQEFKELGVAKTPDGPRVYRRKHVELALRIRELVFGEGLTLAGARRRLESERPATDEPDLEEVATVEGAGEDSGHGESGLDAAAKARLRSLRDDVRALLADLSSEPQAARPEPAAAPARARPVRVQEPKRTTVPEPTPAPEREGAAPVREFTLEPLDFEPHLGDEEPFAAAQAERGKRKRRDQP